MTIDNIFIGLMSGTSIDAVDAVAVEITNHEYKIISTHSAQIPTDLRAQILDLCDPQKESIQKLAETDHQLGKLLAVMGKLFAIDPPALNKYPLAYKLAMPT